MHKRKKNIINNKYDQYILEALKTLPKPLKTFDGHNVYFDINKRKETIFEHISNKKHHFHTSDIMQIPGILKNKECLKNDRYGLSYRNYVGRRKKKNEKKKYIKIVTHVKKNKDESVISIYTVKTN